MSICNECWGKGWIEKQGVQFDCRKCKGTGVIENEPQTNEEWFCQLSTEEKAEVLRDMVMTDSYGFYDKIQYEEDWGCNGSKVIEGWLKQPHKE